VRGAGGPKANMRIWINQQ